jgi:protein-disulfide isomerase
VSDPALSPGLSGEDHVDGPERAELDLVMYGDFQCPYSASAHSIVKRVREQLAGRLLFAFRHFPLHRVHPLAQGAAEAAEGAAAQGAFWPMHDRLFEAHGRLEPRDLTGYARELGLNAERMDAELESRAHAARIERDLRSSETSGVAGTPAFFTNRRLHEGALDAGSVVAALESTASPLG